MIISITKEIEKNHKLCLKMQNMKIFCAKKRESDSQIKNSMQ